MPPLRMLPPSIPFQLSYLTLGVGLAVVSVLGRALIAINPSVLPVMPIAENKKGARVKGLNHLPQIIALLNIAQLVSALLLVG